MSTFVQTAEVLHGYDPHELQGCPKTQSQSAWRCEGFEAASSTRTNLDCWWFGIRKGGIIKNDPKLRHNMSLKSAI